jgi:hypothetical protein
MGSAESLGFLMLLSACCILLSTGLFFAGELARVEFRVGLYVSLSILFLMIPEFLIF